MILLLGSGADFTVCTSVGKASHPSVCSQGSGSVIPWCYSLLWFLLSRLLGLVCTRVNSGQGGLIREMPEMSDPKSDLESGSKGSSRGMGSRKASSLGMCGGTGAGVCLLQRVWWQRVHELCHSGSRSLLHLLSFGGRSLTMNKLEMPKCRYPPPDLIPVSSSDR